MNARTNRVNGLLLLSMDSDSCRHRHLTLSNQKASFMDFGKLVFEGRGRDIPHGEPLILKSPSQIRKKYVSIRPTEHQRKQHPSHQLKQEMRPRTRGGPISLAGEYVPSGVVYKPKRSDHHLAGQTSNPPLLSAL